MTNEKAIDLLDNLIGMVEDNQENNYDEALKIGIEALKHPVIHAKWEHITYFDGGFGMNETCSNCGCTIHGQIFDLVDKYCSNCGAKMDGGSENVN